MQITLPPELAARVRLRVAAGNEGDELEVIRQALDLMDAQDEELRAIKKGIDSWQAGEVRDFDEFDREFIAKRGIVDPDA